MKILFFIKEFAIFVVGVIIALAFGMFIELPRSIKETIKEEVIEPANDSFESWKIRRKREKCHHRWSNGDYGQCLNKCGTYKFQD
jgi:hypothetical protein